jgi:hypothetical protein
VADAGTQPPAIDVVDYEGTPVRCEATRWAEKIEANHPELVGQQAAVALAIATPELVLQDRDYPNRRHLVRRRSSRTYIDAVVEYRYGQHVLTGRLVTAFVRARLRADDLVLYINVRKEPQ